MSMSTKEMLHQQLKSETPTRLRELRKSFSATRFPLMILGVSGMLFASFLFSGMHLMGGSAIMILVFFLSFVHSICTASMDVIDELLDEGE